MGLLTMTNLVFVAGLLHLCQVPAMVAAPRMLGWKSDLAKLEPINRRIVGVIGLAIMLVVIGLGLVVMAAPAEVAGGSRAGAGLAGFLGVFWAYRLGAQVFVYARIWPRGLIGRGSHHALSVLFASLTVIYLAAFLVFLAG